MIDMLPVYFGEPPTSFGLVHPHEGAGRCEALVICPPLLGEAICTHWALKRVAQWASEEGYDVIRFDLSGTGNSLSETASATLATWVDDVGRAIDYVEGCYGAGRVKILGARLGFALAGLASLQRDVDVLIGWDPLLDGKTWLEDRKADREDCADGCVDYKGYQLSGRMLAELSELQVRRIDCVEASAVTTSNHRPDYPLEQLGIDVFAADDAWNWSEPIDTLFFAHESVRLICERLQ